MSQFSELDKEAKLFVNNYFTKQCGDLKINETDDLGTFDPALGEHQLISGLMHLNLVSIAKVCSTDVLTVEHILKEIVAQMVHQVKKGNNLRL